MELLDADVVMFQRNGADIRFDPVPDGRDGAPERLDGGWDQLFSCILGYQHIYLNI
jgi:hypothetical protein